MLVDNENIISPVEVSKAESNPTGNEAKNYRFKPVGVPFMTALGGYIKDSSKVDLQFPRSIKTFQEMRQHPVVAMGATVGEVFLIKSLFKGRAIAGKSSSERSKQAAKFLNWNLRNLEGGGWYDTCTNMVTCFQNGFSWSELVYGKTEAVEPQEGFPYMLRKIAPRAAESVERWLWKDELTRQDLIGLRQFKQTSYGSPSLVSNVVTSNYISQNPAIPLEKIVLCSWNSKNGNPQGTSDFVEAYKPWKELSMIEAYELMGISKDLSGVLVVRMPNDHLMKAQSDASSPEALALTSFMKQAAAIQAGDQTFFILPSDTQGENGNGKYVYDMALQGVDGGSGKNYNTKDVIAMKEKSILNTFGAGFLTLGDTATGSYSLADTKQSLHAFYMERKLLFLADVIERQIFKRLLELNNFKLSEDEFPRFEYGELDDADADVASKVGQRLSSGGLFPLQKDMLIQLWRQCGLDCAVIEDMSEQEILETLTAYTSRAGESQGTSGTGDTQSGGSNSSLNSENAA